MALLYYNFHHWPSNSVSKLESTLTSPITSPSYPNPIFLPFLIISPIFKLFFISPFTTLLVHVLFFLGLDYCNNFLIHLPFYSLPQVNALHLKPIHELTNSTATLPPVILLPVITLLLDVTPSFLCTHITFDLYHLHTSYHTLHCFYCICQLAYSMQAIESRNQVLSSLLFQHNTPYTVSYTSLPLM